MSDIRILLVDDSAQFRDGLSVLLDSISGMLVVGQAVDGEDAVTRALALQPDVVLMDINMPIKDGIAAAADLAARAPHIAIVMLTMLDEDESVFAAMRAGSRGYVVKGARQDEMARAIRAAFAGDVVFGAAIARRMASYFNGISTIDPGLRAFADLTDREREILDLIARGHNNQQISDTLGLSLKTVRNYVSSLLTKLQVTNRAAAIVRAREAGVGDPRRREQRQVTSEIVEDKPRSSDRRLLATVLFTDIVGSTQMATSLGDAAWGELLARHDRVVRECLAEHNGREVKQTGDGFLAMFALPGNAMECAVEIVARGATTGIPIRAGMHIGECVYAAGDLHGLTVHIAARVAAQAGPAEILITRAMTDLTLGSSRFELSDRGLHTLKGVEGSWRLWAIDSSSPSTVLDA